MHGLSFLFTSSTYTIKWYASLMLIFIALFKFICNLYSTWICNIKEASMHYRKYIFKKSCSAMVSTIFCARLRFFVHAYFWFCLFVFELFILLREVLQFAKQANNYHLLQFHFEKLNQTSGNYKFATDKYDSWLNRHRKLEKCISC